MTRTLPVRGVVWKTGSVLCLARVVGWDGLVLAPDDVDSISYTLSLIDAEDSAEATEVSAHADVELTPADVLEESLVTDDDRWTLDDTGYNFSYLLDTTENPAFTEANRKYVLTFRFAFADQPPVLVVFQLDCRLA